tara:strand:- start:1078 stop:1983 length:906 start_codon:yes stop_codon:yes gene_type:complete
MIIYVIVGSLGWGLPASNEQAIGEVSRWCERVSAGIFREPSNALSNLGFMIVGLLMFRTLSKDSDYLLGLNQFFGHTPVSLLYAGSVVWLGAGSLLMHGTHTGWGASADNLSMVMYILIPWLFNLSQMGGWSDQKLLTLYGTLVVIYGVGREFLGSRLGINLDLFDISIALWCISELLYRYWSPRFRFLSGFSGFIVAAVFGIFPIEMISQPDKYWWVVLFWVPGIFSNYRPIAQRRYYPWFFLGMGTYFTAFVIWLTGRPSHPWCEPDSVIQAHAVWHLLSALSTWFFFKYFRTERGIRL